MQVINITLSSVIKKTRMPLIIGGFDVIHKGHMSLFNETTPDEFCVLIIDNIPRKKQNFNSLEDRIENVKKLRPKIIFIYDVNNCNMTAIDFVKNILTKIAPSQVIIGSDFMFGIDFKNGSDLLSSYFKVKPIPCNKNYQTYLIRKLYSAGNIEQARDLLCFPVFIKGIVTHGKKLGRQISFPTLNFYIDIAKTIDYKPGVYACIVLIHNKEYKSALYIATPENNLQLLEANIVENFPYVDEQENIGQPIKVELLKYINELKKVHDIDELKECVNKNVFLVKQFFRRKDNKI